MRRGVLSGAELCEEVADVSAMKIVSRGTVLRWWEEWKRTLEL